jgi:hypothetical protein
VNITHGLVADMFALAYRKGSEALWSELEFFVDEGKQVSQFNMKDFRLQIPNLNTQRSYSQSDLINVGRSIADVAMKLALLPDSMLYSSLGVEDADNFDLDLNAIDGKPVIYDGYRYGDDNGQVVIMAPGDTLGDPEPLKAAFLEARLRIWNHLENIGVDFAKVTGYTFIIPSEANGTVYKIADNTGGPTRIGLSRVRIWPTQRLNSSAYLIAHLPGDSKPFEFSVTVPPDLTFDEDTANIYMRAAFRVRATASIMKIETSSLVLNNPNSLHANIPVAEAVCS